MFVEVWKNVQNIGFLSFHKNYVNVPLACCQPLCAKFRYPDSWEQPPEQQDDSAKGLMPMTSQMIQQKPNVRVCLITAEIGIL